MAPAMQPEPDARRGASVCARRMHPFDSELAQKPSLVPACFWPRARLASDLPIVRSPLGDELQEFPTFLLRPPIPRQQLAQRLHWPCQLGFDLSKGRLNAIRRDALCQCAHGVIKVAFPSTCAKGEAVQSEPECTVDWWRRSHWVRIHAYSSLPESRPPSTTAFG